MASESWQSKTKSITQRSRKLYEDCLHTDITFNLVDEQGTVVSFKAHKLILGMTSEVFEAMFYGSLAEKGTEITIKDVTSNAFMNILGYTYLGELKLEDVSEAIETALAAQMYLFSHLYELCIEYLMKNLSVETACVCYEASKFLGDEKLEIESFKIINNNNDDFFELPNFVTLSKESVLYLTNKPILKVNPLTLFEGFYRWSKHQSEIEGSSKSLREHIEPFLPRIEFLRLTSREFLKTVIPTSVLNNEEAAAIGRNLEENGVLQCPLPSWCNTCYDDGIREQGPIIFNIENIYWEHWKIDTKLVLKFSVTEEVNLLGYRFYIDKPADVDVELRTVVEVSSGYKATQTDTLIYKETTTYLTNCWFLTIDLKDAVAISPLDDFCKITVRCSSLSLDGLKCLSGIYKNEQPSGEIIKLAVGNPTVSYSLFRGLRFSKLERQFINIKEEE